MEEDILQKDDYIMNPFTQEGSELPMCLVTYLNNHYLGGLGGFDDQGRIILMLPLIYREIPDPRQQRTVSMMGSVFNFNPLIEIFFIRGDGVYMLKSDHKGDKNLVREYENTINNFKAAEVGIIMPDSKDFSNLGK